MARPSSRSPLGWKIDVYNGKPEYRVVRDLAEGKRTPEEVIKALEVANLRGMGGAGFPTFRQTATCFLSVPIRLLRVAEDNPMRSHARRARSRSAVTRPFLRISEIESSIFGPFAAASSSFLMPG